MRKTESEAETMEWASEFAGNLRSGDVVALTGELGTGKTQVVKGICDRFGCLEMVSSPTFTIINEYVTPEITIKHVDLFRLEESARMFETGFFDLFDGHGIVLVEWAEKVYDCLPLPYWHVSLEHGLRPWERVIKWKRVVKSPAREERRKQA